VPAGKLVTGIGQATIDKDERVVMSNGRNAPFIVTDKPYTSVRLFEEKRAKYYHWGFLICAAIGGGCCLYLVGRHAYNAYLRYYEKTRLLEYREQRRKKRQIKKRREREEREAAVEEAKLKQAAGGDEKKGQIAVSRQQAAVEEGLSLPEDPDRPGRRRVEPPKEDGESSDDSLDNGCLICCAKEVDCVLLPCGHMYQCTDCAQQLRGKRCPWCKKGVTEIKRVYFRT